MDIVRLSLAWMLVWAFGAALVVQIYRRGSKPLPHPAWMAGTGFLAGAFVLILLMSLVSRLGASFTRTTLGVPLVLGLVALLVPQWRRWRSSTGPHAGVVASLRVARSWSWPRVVWWLLIAWLALRGAVLLGEVLRQPLFPWDAWTQWATKARVWFALRHMVPFEQAGQWLQDTSGAYYDAAPHYPATVPLWQVWSSVALARWDDALMNLPWWLLGLALALLLYGFLRDEGASPLFSLVVTWMIVSMPIIETHVALAGYADLPMACYLTAAGLAGLRALAGWRVAEPGPGLDRRLRAPDAAVALLFVAALPTIKNPGWIWVLMLLPGLLVAVAGRLGLRIVLTGWVAGVALSFLLGRYEPVILGYHLHFQLNVPWHGLGEAYLSFANWHLLFWALPLLVALAWRWVVAREIAPLTVVVGSGALFLLLGFSLTSAAVWVEDQSTVNRATLHLAPLIGVWLALLVHHALAQRGAEVDRAPAPVRVEPVAAPAAVTAMPVPADAPDA